MGNVGSKIEDGFQALKKKQAGDDQLIKVLKAVAQYAEENIDFQEEILEHLQHPTAVSKLLEPIHPNNTISTSEVGQGTLYWNCVDFEGDMYFVDLELTLEEIRKHGLPFTFAYLLAPQQQLQNYYQLGEVFSNRFEVPALYRIFNLVFDGDYNVDLDAFLTKYKYLEFVNIKGFHGNQLLIELIDAGFEINPFTAKIYNLRDSNVTLIKDAALIEVETEEFISQIDKTLAELVLSSTQYVRFKVSEAAKTQLVPVFADPINLKKLAVVVQKRLSSSQVVNFKSFITEDFVYLNIEVAKLKPKTPIPDSPQVLDQVDNHGLRPDLPTFSHHRAWESTQSYCYNQIFKLGLDKLSYVHCLTGVSRYNNDYWKYIQADFPEFYNCDRPADLGVERIKNLKYFDKFLLNQFDVQGKTLTMFQREVCLFLISNATNYDRTAELEDIQFCKFSDQSINLAYQYILVFFGASAFYNEGLVFCRVDDCVVATDVAESVRFKNTNDYVSFRHFNMFCPEVQKVHEIVIEHGSNAFEYYQQAGLVFPNDLLINNVLTQIFDDQLVVEFKFSQHKSLLDELFDQLKYVILTEDRLKFIDYEFDINFDAPFVKLTFSKLSIASIRARKIFKSTAEVREYLLQQCQNFALIILRLSKPIPRFGDLELEDLGALVMGTCQVIGEFLVVRK